jgi:hypothetical protein
MIIVDPSLAVGGGEKLRVWTDREGLARGGVAKASPPPANNIEPASSTASDTDNFMEPGVVCIEYMYTINARGKYAIQSLLQRDEKDKVPVSQQEVW